MFIHWGVYSSLANGEWGMNRSKIPVAEYKAMASKFNPVEFDADEWVAVAKNAGMRYMTITSKHHDGFAMFDSDVSDYNIVDYTPFKRDVIQELKDACGRPTVVVVSIHPERDHPTSGTQKERIHTSCEGNGNVSMYR